jgi:L-methionine (R)-S-oxide reductase
MNQEIIASLKEELARESRSISKLGNSLALIKEALGNDSWVGLYLFDEKNNVLFLGPFQGSPACETIKPGKGVVGTCYAAKRPLYIDDVKKFPGYIACDSKTKSEAVFPLKLGEDVIGVFDIDSPKIDGLKDDLKILEEAASLIANFNS